MKIAMRSITIIVVFMGIMLSMDQVQAEEDSDWIGQAYQRSYNYERIENFADAIKALSRVLDTYAKGYTVNLRIAWLSYRMGYYANSIQHYQSAIKISPNSLEARLGILMPQLAQERYNEAEQTAYQIIYRDYFNYYANLRLITALRQQQKTELARVVVQKMRALYPTDVALLVELGRIHAQAGDAEQAAKVFRDVIVLDPENVAAHQHLRAQESNASD